MDYKKEYEDAINRGLDFIKHTPANVMVSPKDVLEHIFPQLKESDDANIKGAIIDHLKDHNLIEWATWLEKHGEGDFAEPIIVFKASDWYVSKVDGKIYNAKYVESQDERIRKALVEYFNHVRYNGLDLKTTNVDEVLSWLENKSGQKLVVIPKFRVGHKIKLSREPKYPAREIVEIKNNAYYFDSLVHLPIERQDEWELVEQNPAWSEEDEERLRGLTYVLDDISQDKRRNFRIISENERDIIKDWLKSFKDRVLPQPKQEWSEEDEVRLDEAIRMVESNGAWVRSEDAVKLVSDWLKALKDRVLPQPKQEWSEEDEKRLAELSSILEIGGNFAISDWLKDLKDKYMPQPKWEWSEEDEDVMNTLIKYLTQECDKTSIPEDKEMFEREISMLKSICSHKQTVEFNEKDIELKELKGEQ